MEAIPEWILHFECDWGDLFVSPTLKGAKISIVPRFTLPPFVTDAELSHPLPIHTFFGE